MREEIKDLSLLTKNIKEIVSKYLREIYKRNIELLKENKHLKKRIKSYTKKEHTEE